MSNIEDKMDEFAPGILDLDAPGPRLYYWVEDDGSVQTITQLTDGSQVRGTDAAGTLAALLGEKPRRGLYTASGKPVSAPLGL